MNVSLSHLGRAPPAPERGGASLGGGAARGPAFGPQDPRCADPFDLFRPDLLAWHLGTWGLGDLELGDLGGFGSFYVKTESGAQWQGRQGPAMGRPRDLAARRRA